MIDGGFMPEKVENEHLFEQAYGKFVSTCIDIVLIITARFITAVGGKYIHLFKQKMLLLFFS